MIAEIQGFLGFVLAWIMGFFENFIPLYITPNLQLITQTVLLIIGAFITGKIVKALTVKLLGVAGLKRITTKTWGESILKVTGYKGSVVELIGDLVKWLVYVLFLGVIIQGIGFPGVANIFNQIAIFIPRFIGSLLIIVIGFIIADFFGKVFEEASRKFLRDETLASLSGGIIKYSVALIALIMALALIGLDTASLNIMLALVLGTAVVALVIGLRDIFPNLTAGIQIRDALKPGEHIKVGDYKGVVERVETLNTILRDGDDRVSVPNSLLVKLPLTRKK